MALQRGQDAAVVAQDALVRLGEDVTADTVLRWRQEAEAAQRRRTEIGVPA